MRAREFSESVVRALILAVVVATLFLTLATPVAAPATVTVPPYACNNRSRKADPAASEADFASTCTDTAGSGVAADDGAFEMATARDAVKTENAGILVKYQNTAVTDCAAISAVELGYEWWWAKIGGAPEDPGAPVSRGIAVDNDGDFSFVNATLAAPSSAPNPGVTRVNVTALEDWTCSNFFGPAGQVRARVKSEARETNTYVAFYWDLLNLTVTYLRELVPPAITVNFPGPYNLTNASIPVSASIDGTGSRVAYAEAVLRDASGGNLPPTRTPLANTGAGPTGPWTGTVDVSGVADGNYTLVFNATDEELNFLNGSGVSPTMGIQVDRAPPAVSWIDPAGPGYTRIDVSVRVRISDATSGTARAEASLSNATGNFSRTVLAPAGGGEWAGDLDIAGIADGNYTLRAEAADQAGNAAGASSGFDLRVDRVAHVITVVRPGAAEYLQSGAATMAVRASVRDGSPVAYAEASLSDGRGNRSRTALAHDGGAEWTGAVNLSSLPGGDYVLFVNATDAAGNSNNSTPIAGSFVRIDRNPPATPGPVGGGTSGSSGGVAPFGMMPATPSPGAPYGVVAQETASGYARAGVPATLYFRVGGVEEIRIETREDGRIQVGVAELSALPVDRPPAGRVHRYLELSSAGAGGATRVLIRFQVEDAWLAGIGAGLEAVRLYRDGAGTWSALPTRPPEAPGRLFEAESPGLSYFAVGAVTSEAPMAPAATPEAGPEPPPPAVPEMPLPPAAPGPPEPRAVASAAVGAGIAGLAVAGTTMVAAWAGFRAVRRKGWARRRRPPREVRLPSAARTRGMPAVHP